MDYTLDHSIDTVSLVAGVDGYRVYALAAVRLDRHGHAADLSAGCFLARIVRIPWRLSGIKSLLIALNTAGLILLLTGG
jgi:hypothetical protein